MNFCIKIYRIVYSPKFVRSLIAQTSAIYRYRCLVNSFWGGQAIFRPYRWKLLSCSPKASTLCIAHYDWLPANGVYFIVNIKKISIMYILRPQSHSTKMRVGRAFERNGYRRTEKVTVNKAFFYFSFSIKSFYNIQPVVAGNAWQCQPKIAYLGWYNNFYLSA